MLINNTQNFTFEMKPGVKVFNLEISAPFCIFPCRKFIHYNSYSHSPFIDNFQIHNSGPHLNSTNVFTKCLLDILTLILWWQDKLHKLIISSSPWSASLFLPVSKWHSFSIHLGLGFCTPFKLASLLLYCGPPCFDFFHLFGM